MSEVYEGAAMDQAATWKAILINAVIVISLTMLGGFAVGLFLGKSEQGAAIALSNFFMVTLGFFIAGMRTNGAYWTQLSIVALLTWLVGITNVLFFHMSFLSWIGGVIACFVFMGIGGGLALLARKRPALSADNSA